jgi:hypothetical protein
MPYTIFSRMLIFIFMMIDAVSYSSLRLRFRFSICHARRCFLSLSLMPIILRFLHIYYFRRQSSSRWYCPRRDIATIIVCFAIRLPYAIIYYGCWLVFSPPIRHYSFPLLAFRDIAHVVPDWAAAMFLHYRLLQSASPFTYAEDVIGRHDTAFSSLPLAPAIILRRYAPLMMPL